MARISSQVTPNYNKTMQQEHFTGETEENYEQSHSQDNRSPGRDFSPGPPEYEAGVLTTRPRR
jgi:hypothetical protein